MISPELAPIHARIAALEQFTRDSRLPVLDQARWRANLLGMLWPEMDAAFMTSAAETAARHDGAAADGPRRRGVASGPGMRRPSSAAGPPYRTREAAPRAMPGVQSNGSAVVDVTSGDYFELIARQTSGATKNIAADELTWLAIEVE